MCHIRRLNYACGHNDSILISRCRKLIPKLTHGCLKSPPEKWLHLKATGELQLDWKVEEAPQIRISACKPSVSLDLYIRRTCGTCQFEERMAEWRPPLQDLERQLASARAVWDGGEAEEVRLLGQMEALLEKKSLDEWECRKRFPTGRKQPILKGDRNLGKNDRRESPLKSELRPEDIPVEVGEAHLPVMDQDGIPYFTFWDFFEDRYAWMGPAIDWSELKVELDIGEQLVAAESSLSGHRTRVGDHNVDLVDVDSKNTKVRAAHSIETHYCHERTLLGIGSRLDLVALGPQAAQRVQKIKT